MRKIILTLCALLFAAFLSTSCHKKSKQTHTAIITTTQIAIKSPKLIQQRFIPLSEHFGYPLGYPDFNGIEGGDSDLGDTIKSIGNGVVTYSSGALLNIMHRTTDKNIPIVTSIYYHCDTLFVSENEIVKAGQVVALVGKKDSNVAHLHFEIATDTNQLAGFYGNDATGFMDPVTFIENHR